MAPQRRAGFSEMRARPEIVGIAAGQSICSVVAMIGIWKAGGAYTYIDYNYPEATKARIVSECQCRLVLDKSFYQNMDCTRDDPIDRSQRDFLFTCKLFVMGLSYL